MKRGWLGAALLLGLLALGISSSRTMEGIHGPLALAANRAGSCALASDWQRAEAWAADAREGWQRSRKFSACFADHGAMEQIDSFFAQLEVYRQAEDPLAFAAVCAALARQLEAMADAHSLCWQNFL